LNSGEKLFLGRGNYFTFPDSPSYWMDCPEGSGHLSSLTAVYELSPAELETLRQACRVVDIIARIDAVLMDSDLVVEGHHGQPRSHPLLAAVADQRRVLDALFRSLSLPMPDEVAGRRRSPAAVAAAQSRWRGSRGSMA
jgi:hypothetical protein